MSVNRAILVGTLGKDPVIGQTQNGKDYANFSLATSKKWKNEAGEKQEKTSWHSISCWGSLAKVCQYLEKGSKVYLEGEIEYGSYKNKEGVEVPSFKIIASGFDIIKGKERDKEASQHAQDKDVGNNFMNEEEDDSTVPF